MIKEIFTAKAPAAIGPYSQGKSVNGLLFLSGQIPVNPENGETVKGTIEEQTERVIQNIAALLEEGGASFSTVIKTTCFLTDMADFGQFNKVYAKYFTGKPARSCVAVSDLPKGCSVEIEVIALTNAENQ